MKLRNILSVVCGVITGFIVIILGQGIMHAVNPLPAGVDLQNTESLKAFIENAPASLHLGILGIYAFACFLGGMVASIIAADKKITKAITLGGIFMGLGIFNLVSVSHPMWVILCSLFAFLPFAYAGGMIGLKFFTKKK